MNRFIKLAATAVAIAGYVLILRYVAPGHKEPYFIVGIALIGFIAWLHGSIAGLAMVPLLNFSYYGPLALSDPHLAIASSPSYISLGVLAAIMLGRLRKINLVQSEKEIELAEINESLQTALSQVREIGGVHCLCSSCKKILDDNGNWMQIDAFLLKTTKMEFSHSLCPDCGKEYGKEQVPATESTGVDNPSFPIRG